MTKGKSSTNETEISILEVMQGELNACLLGIQPLIFNAMSEKVRHELLMPAPKKNAAAKAANLKHQPLDEYRNSTYQNRDKDADTRLNFPASAFKRALASAALDIPGAAKAQIGRLVWCTGDRVDIYGVPKMLMAITRSADMNKTPDVRTRAIVPEWACRISLRFMKPILKDQVIANLLAAAGFTQGIGDWRQQKGAGSYGQFKLVSENDKDFVRICKQGGRVAQDAGLNAPTFYDEETERLYTWFNAEVLHRYGSERNGKSVTVTAEA